MLVTSLVLMLLISMIFVAGWLIIAAYILSGRVDED